MKVLVDAAHVVGTVPRLWDCQNTTLRCAPGPDFPAAFERAIGRPDIVRLFVGLDEAWDYRTNEYRWDYRIGVNPYIGDQNHFAYDWSETVPSVTGVTELAYLTSHAEHANQVLLCVRRYEREVLDGIIGWDTYERVLYDVISHYKELIPNIRYIEASNETEVPHFGGLTVDEYYRVYQSFVHVVEGLNADNGYEMPLEVGGSAMSGGMWNFHLWREFLEHLAADPQRYIDFYSFHEYHADAYRIYEFYQLHNQLVQELGLPKAPLLMTEYGMRYGLGDAGRPNNLQNASGEIPGFFVALRCPGLRVFPWCSFHDPSRQLGRTMFVLRDGTYLPTPNAHVMKMLTMLGTAELEQTYWNRNCALATSDNGRDGNYAILVTNPGAAPEVAHVRIDHLPQGAYRIMEYLVDATHNNVLTDSAQDHLASTREFFQQVGSTFALDVPLEPTSFALLVLDLVPTD